MERTCQSCYGHAMQQAQDVYRCGAELWDTCRAATEALGARRPIRGIGSLLGILFSSKMQTVEVGRVALERAWSVSHGSEKRESRDTYRSH